MSGGEPYQPSTSGAVECPTCGAVAFTLPADMPLDMVGLSHLRCPACGQQWNECRVPSEQDYRRFWEPRSQPRRRRRTPA